MDDTVRSRIKKFIGMTNAEIEKLVAQNSVLIGDIEVNKKLEIYCIPSKFGVEKTMQISKIFHALTEIFWLLFKLVPRSAV